MNNPSDDVEDLFEKDMKGKVVALKFESEAVGEVISMSLHEDRFYFSIDNTLHKLIVQQFTFSNKIKLVLDNVVIFDGEEKGFFESIFADKTFEHRLVIKGVEVFVKRDDDILDVQFDGQSFARLLHYTKKKKLEKKQAEKSDNIALAKSYFQSLDQAVQNGSNPFGKTLSKEPAIFKTPFDDDEDD